MRHDRNGDLIEDQADAEQPATHHCDHGWLDRDAEPAVPCLTCRPHLATPRPRKPAPNAERIHRGVDLCRRALTTKELTRDA